MIYGVPFTWGVAGGVDRDDCPERGSYNNKECSKIYQITTFTITSHERPPQSHDNDGMAAIPKNVYLSHCLLVQFFAIWSFVEVEVSRKDFIGTFSAQDHFTSGCLDAPSQKEHWS